MGTYIKDMEFPQSCGGCSFFMWTNGDMDAIPTCSRTWEQLDDEDLQRPQSCPLVDIKTPHGRLIDAHALVELVYQESKTMGEPYKDLELIVEQLVDKIPAVIDAEE